MLKIAINGFGRIGRTALRLLENDMEAEVVAINDLTDAEQLAYLYKYDSVHRTIKSKVNFDDKEITIGDNKIKVFCESDPTKLPWKDLGIDIVLECTGVFTSRDKAKHILKRS
jgi:glyceraldehyde 3-phosphate dehydrogenase